MRLIARLGLLISFVGSGGFFETVCPARSAAEDRPQVGVFVEEGFPAYGGMPALPPWRIPTVLTTNEISVEVLNAAALMDPVQLNPRRIPVLVLPYGNAFPRLALAPLRAYHAAGGCLVMNGVPFTHPCDRVDGRWQDLGNAAAYRHRDGMGTGGFGGPLSPGQAGSVAVPPNPLELTSAWLPDGCLGGQWLDRTSLADADEVFPLVTVTGADGKTRPLAALVRHGCREFAGARDAWLGQIASGPDEANAVLAGQLLVRAVTWCLAEKDLFPRQELPRQWARLEGWPRPAPWPDQLPVVDRPRPWGDTYLPKSNRPAPRLQVVEVGALSPAERVALTCLQGLTSRQQPRLWLVRGPADRQWLDWHVAQGHLQGYDLVTNWPALFRDPAVGVRGALVADPALYRGDLLAVNVAACEDLIVADPELAARLGLTVKLDLRGRFGTYAAGLRWLWSTYADRLNPALCDFMHPARLQNCVFDYAYAWRGLVFWIAGTVDERERGADRFAEQRVMAEILAQLMPNTPVMGFPYHGEGVGPGEPAGVALASRYAKGLVCTDYLANTTVMSGVRVEKFARPAPPSAPPLAKDRVYIALVVSDGDNQNLWTGMYRRWFEHPAFGRFPLAFGLGPPIVELMPALAQWFQERAPANVEFIADVSGVAYIQPENYARAYADRKRVVEGYLDWTARLMPTLGLRSVRTVGGADEELQPYANALPFCHSLFADMGRYSGREGITNLTYTLPVGMPVFRAVTSWRYGKEGFLREIREQVGTHRPAFVNGFVHCWTFGMDDLERIAGGLDPDMVLVTPSQLAALYREAQRGEVGQ